MKMVGMACGHCLGDILQSFGQIIQGNQGAEIWFTFKQPPTGR
jgi:hypothetical protein